MTTVIILILGGAAVLIISAVESNPDGSDVSIIQAVKDIWNDNLNFQQGNTAKTAAQRANDAAAQQAINHGVIIGASGPLGPLSTNAAATSQIQASAM